MFRKAFPVVLAMLMLGAILAACAPAAEEEAAPPDDAMTEEMADEDMSEDEMADEDMDNEDMSDDEMTDEDMSGDEDMADDEMMDEEERMSAEESMSDEEGMADEDMADEDMSGDEDMSDEDMTDEDMAGEDEMMDEAMMEDATAFTVHVENLSVALAPGVWAVYDGSHNPVFTDGEANRGEGLEPLAEDGAPSTLDGALDGHMSVLEHGLFDTPVGMEESGALMTGEAYEFTIHAIPGSKLVVATMYSETNDLFYAPLEGDIELFDADGNPISGNVTDQFGLWDAGTEVNQAPGEGADQGPRQAAPNTGEDEGGVVHLVDDGFTYPAVTDAISVTIEPGM